MEQEKIEIMCKDLRSLAETINELAERPDAYLDVTVFVTVYPDGSVYIE